MVSYSFEGNKRLWKVRDGEENEKIFSEESKNTVAEIPSEIKPGFVEGDGEKWPLIHLMRLLRFYAAHRCLWDVGCKDNRNRKLRHSAIIDIRTALNTGATKNQVVQKINILRATYRYEKKRIKQRIRKGLGARTKLKWFALADAFLRNVPKKGQKQEDPSNSDSDLEDTIVFTINPETLMPLDQELSSELLEENCKNKEILQSEQKKISQCDQFYNTSLVTPPLNSCTFVSNKDSTINENNVNALRRPWKLEDTLLFLQLLQNNSFLLENPFESCDNHRTVLESISKEMNCSYKTIEKRWYILQKTFQQEQEKIVKNPLYKPRYGWWPQAEQLFIKILNSKSNMPHKVDMPTEFIDLHESQSLASDREKDCENVFMENPLPSVAPLSNMNEEMASLFYDMNHNDCEESNTMSSTTKENESSNSSKFAWHSLEDDLLEGKWSLKHSVKFLRLYGVHRCLWDLNDPDYRSKPLRNAAMADIAASMGHGLTASYVAKKIKIFRITYMQQRKRLLHTEEKGEKADILLKWFPLADSFLRPHIGLRSIKSDAKEISQFNYQYVYANLNLIDPALLNDFRGKGTQNVIEIGNDRNVMDTEGEDS